MPQLTRKIIWKKFVDPFEPDKEEEKGKNNTPEDDEDDNYGDETPWEKLEKGKYEDDDMGFTGKHFKAIQTPAGIFPLNESSFPGRQFNLWIGHTNFKITHEIASIIDKNIDGVEIFKVTTPYRFMLAIGLAFDEQEVKNSIVNTICDISEIKHENVEHMFQYIEKTNDSIPDDTIKKVNDILATVPKDQYIVVFVLPNLRLKIIKSNSLDTEFINSVEQLYITKQSVGGAIFTKMPIKDDV